jgi:hypothetical protein
MIHEFTFPTTGIKTPQATLLAIDDTSLPLRRNLCDYLSKPTYRREPVLTPSRENRDAPDFIGTHFYGTVLLDEGKYRMWYYAVGLGDKPGELREGPICYAESDDGLHFVKPALRQVAYKGSLENNAIALPDPRIDIAPATPAPRTSRPKTSVEPTFVAQASGSVISIDGRNDGETTYHCVMNFSWTSDDEPTGSRTVTTQATLPGRQVNRVVFISGPYHNVRFVGLPRWNCTATD